MEEVNYSFDEEVLRRPRRPPKKRFKTLRFVNLLIFAIVFWFILSSSSYFKDINASNLGELESFSNVNEDIDYMFALASGPFKDDPYVNSMRESPGVEEYRESFKNNLVILKDKLSRVSEEPKEKKYLIEDFSNSLETLKSDYFAGADFEPVYNYKLGSGEKILESGFRKGVYFSGDASREKAVRSIVVDKDLSDYRTVAKSVADVFNVNVEYGFKNFEKSGCTTEGLVENVFGLFCSGSINTVYIADDRKSSKSYGSSYLVDTVKHELAHRAIHLKCGTPRPKIADGNTERTTSSYAVIYYGANRELLNRSVGDGYDTNLESDRIAREIHDFGKCYS